MILRGIVEYPRAVLGPIVAIVLLTRSHKPGRNRVGL